MLGYTCIRSLKKLGTNTQSTNCAGITGGSLQMSAGTLSNEAASKNLVKGFVEKGQWKKVEKLATEGNAFAVTAIQQHKKDEDKPKTPHVQQPSRYAAKKAAKTSVDFTQLQGPAAAGKRGGGKDAPPVNQPPIGSKEALKMGLGVKTNVGGGNGPKKTATTIVKNVSDGGKGKGKKGKNK